MAEPPDGPVDEDPFDGLDDPEAWEPIPRRFRRRHRVVALLAAVAVLLAAVAAVFVRGEGTSVEVFGPSGSGVVDLQRFGEVVRPDVPAPDRGAPGPAALAARADLVVVGRITGLRVGRTQQLPPEYALADQQLVSMDVAVEEVVSGELPAGTGGELEVELGVERVRQPAPARVAAVAPRGSSVVLYLRRAQARGPFELSEPDGAEDAGRLRWWAIAPQGFLVADGHGGVVSLIDGRELPGTSLADVLPPHEAWPTVARAPALSCDPSVDVAGPGVPGGWPALSAVDPPGPPRPPRAPTLEAALQAFAATERAVPAVEAPIPVEERPSPGYAVVFESLTNRTVAYRGLAGEVLAVFYATGTDGTGWRIDGFQACGPWYEALPPAPADPSAGRPT